MQSNLFNESIMLFFIPQVVNFATLLLRYLGLFFTLGQVNKKSTTSLLSNATNTLPEAMKIGYSQQFAKKADFFDWIITVLKHRASQDILRLVKLHLCCTLLYSCYQRGTAEVVNDTANRYIKVNFVTRVKGAGVYEKMTLIVCLFYHFEITDHFWTYPNIGMLQWLVGS